VYKTQDFNLFFSILRKRKRKRTTEKVTETKQQEERERERAEKGLGKLWGLVQEENKGSFLEMTIDETNFVMSCALVILLWWGYSRYDMDSTGCGCGCGSCWALFFQGWPWFSTSLVKPTWPEKTVVSRPNAFLPPNPRVSVFGPRNRYVIAQSLPPTQNTNILIISSKIMTSYFVL
jgi:hypothetical protein